MRSFSEYISEGGQFGHLNNIWEVGNLTTRDLIKIIDRSLNLDFGIVDVKLDSVALSFTVREDGKVVGSRNKGQSKNFGMSGLDINAMAEKFKGHQLEFAYTWALRNLQDAVDHLSDRQKKKIFAGGRNWMAVEVIGWGASNIIDYAGVKELVLLGTIEHDIDGNKIGDVDKGNAKILDGMLRQKSAEKQSKFEIKSVSPATFRDIKDSEKHKKVLKAQVKSIMKGANTIEDFKEREFKKVLMKKTKNAELMRLLLDRWVHFNKSTSITKIYKMFPEDRSWIQALDKKANSIVKDIILPLEKVFLRLGAEVMSALDVFKSKDPEKTAAKIRKDFSSAVDKITASGEEKLIKKLSLELSRLEAAGGTGAIAPEEGITFFINDGKGDKTLVKLTGTFAPVNQIIGLLYNIQER